MPDTRKTTEKGRPNRKRKRQFYGNRYTATKETSRVSAAAEKLKDSNYDGIEINSDRRYVILEYLTVFTFLSTILKCKACDSDISFSRQYERGLGFRLEVACGCLTAYCVFSSPLVNKAYEINRRIMFAIRLLGLGLRPLNIFCSVMELSNGFSRTAYYSFVSHLNSVSKIVFVGSQKKAFEEEKLKGVQEGKKENLISVSGDGTWKKRGFSSLFGITTLVGKYTHKVLDLVVKSSFCQACSNWASRKSTPEYTAWKSTHDEECSANHEGSAGLMEVDAVKEMFARSQEIAGAMYDEYTGDGDTKTFKGVLDLDPYEDLIVEKKECVGHVQKRMGSRLRTAKKEKTVEKKVANAAKKKAALASKKKPRGTNAKNNKQQPAPKVLSLTLNLIKELTLYFGLAIRRHPDSTEAMRNEIWSTFYHKSSTDEFPQHQQCPPGETSWCKWQVAKAAGELDSFKHKPAIEKSVQNLIRPIYTDLSDEKLLKRCIGGNTQNDNESLNSCIWKFAPKHLHCGVDTVEIAAYMAASIYNDGYAAVMRIMNLLDIDVGANTLNLAKDMDNARIDQAENQVKEVVKEIRVAKRRLKLQQKVIHEEEEGIAYGPGIDEEL